MINDEDGKYLTSSITESHRLNSPLHSGRQRQDFFHYPS